MFSSVSQALHWAFLIDGGAQLEVRGHVARVAYGVETRSLDIGDLTASDLRSICAAALRTARARLTRFQWGALCARFANGRIRAEGFAVLIEWVTPAVGVDLAADAASLFADYPSETAGSRALSGARGLLVGSALASLPTDYLSTHMV